MFWTLASVELLSQLAKELLHIHKAIASSNAGMSDTGVPDTMHKYS